MGGDPSRLKRWPRQLLRALAIGHSAFLHTGLRLHLAPDQRCASSRPALCKAERPIASLLPFLSPSLYVAFLLSHSPFLRVFVPWLQLPLACLQVNLASAETCLPRSRAELVLGRPRSRQPGRLHLAPSGWRFWGLGGEPARECWARHPLPRAPFRLPPWRMDTARLGFSSL